MQKQVFISYGHADAAVFARKLKERLDREGFLVWWDEDGIRAGEKWAEAIEDAIKGSMALVAILTRAATRPGSICRQEVRFAFHLPRPVIPAKATPDSGTTLDLAVLSWIDFTTDFDKGVEELLAFLKQGTVPRPREFIELGDVMPLSFASRLAELTWKFVGRKELFNELGDWLLQPRAKPMVLVGAPGIGKSAIAAQLATSCEDVVPVTRERQWEDLVVAVHFCDGRDHATLDPYRFVGSLVAQLHGRMPEFAAKSEGMQSVVEWHTAGQMFHRLIVAPSREMEQDQPRLIIIDSLDEARTVCGENILDVLVDHEDSLPRWLRIVATARKDPEVPAPLRSWHTLDLDERRSENDKDLDKYAGDRLGLSAKQPLPHHTDLELKDRIVEVSQGNFLVSRFLLDAIEEGTQTLDDLGRVPLDLQGFYHRSFRKRFPDRERFPKDYGDLLSALAVAPEPLPFRLIEKLLHGEREAHDRLRDIGQLLRVQDDSYSFFHRSLADWLLDRSAAGDYWCSPERGHKAIAAVVEPLLMTGRTAPIASRGPVMSYAHRHGLVHFLGGGKLDLIVSLLKDDQLLNVPDFFRAAVQILVELDMYEEQGRSIDDCVLACSELMDRIWRSEESRHQDLIDAFASKCEAAGHWERAAQVYRRVLNHAETETAIRAERGLAQVESARGNLRDAVRRAERALRLTEQAEPAPQSLSWQVGLMRSKNTFGRAILDLGNVDGRWKHHLSEAFAQFEEIAQLASQATNSEQWNSTLAPGLACDCMRQRARALDNMGVIQRLRGHHEVARENMQHALGLFEKHGRDRDLAWCHRDLGWLEWDAGNEIQATGHFKQALRCAEKSGDPQAQLWVFRDLAGTSAEPEQTEQYRHQAYRAWSRLKGMACFYDLAGYFPRKSAGPIGLDELQEHALQWYEDALARFRAADVHWQRLVLANIYRGLAWCWTSLSALDLGKAATYLLNEAEFRRGLGDYAGVGQALWACVRVAQRAMEVVDVDTAHEACRRILSATGQAGSEGIPDISSARAGALLVLASVHSVRLDNDTFLECAQEALALRKRFDPDRVPSARYRIARAYYHRKQDTQAEAAFKEALRSAKEVGDTEVESGSNRHLARMYLHRDVDKSCRYADSADDATGRHPFVHESLLNRCLRGEIDASRGDWESARGQFENALNMAQKAGFPWAESLCLLSLALVVAKSAGVEEALELARKAPGEGTARRLASRKDQVLRYLQAIQHGRDAKSDYDELRQGEFRWLP
jgi:tetratricopeptide (TPR) repeat protein